MDELYKVGSKISEIRDGSIILIVEFEGLHALQCFWALYELGMLRNMLYHELVTDDFLQSHQTAGAEFKVHVKREDYEKTLSKSLAKFLAELAKGMLLNFQNAKIIHRETTCAY